MRNNRTYTHNSLSIPILTSWIQEFQLYTSWSQLSCYFSPLILLFSLSSSSCHLSPLTLLCSGSSNCQPLCPSPPTVHVGPGWASCGDIHCIGIHFRMLPRIHLFSRYLSLSLVVLGESNLSRCCVRGRRNIGFVSWSYKICVKYKVGTNIWINGYQGDSS